MNEQIDLSTRKRGIVINFHRHTEKQLNSMIKDVGLKLSVSQLNELQNYYRKVEKRDPTLDELYFLGEYFTGRDCSQQLVNELTTNSKAIAETYADAMEKRETLTKSDEPPTVGELYGLSSKYLESRGKGYTLYVKKKKKLISRVLALSGRDAELRLAAEGYNTACKSPVGAVGIKSAKKQKAPKLKKGDFILLIAPTPEMTAKDFTAALSDPMLSTCGDCMPIVIPMEYRTIIDAVSSIPRGIYLDLDALYDNDGATSELDDLCRRPYGVIAVVKANDIIDVLQLASAAKLNATVIGSLINKDRISVRHGNYPLVTFSRGLLSAVSAEAPLSLRHSGDMPAGELVANFRSLSRNGSFSLATAESRIGASESSPFITAVYTALTAVAQCVASGADYNDISLSSDIPKDLSPADTLSAVLGLYRVETELCIPHKAGRIGVRGDRIAISAAAKLKHGQTPALLCAPSNRVYLLLPRYNAEGLPDFEDMRKMWRYLRTLCSENNVSSAFATGHDGAATALKAISARCDFIPNPELDPTILEKCAAGGFIVETPFAIEGIFIGKTVAKPEISQ